MKRLLLAVTILACGTVFFAALRQAAARLRAEEAVTRDALTAHTRLLAQAQSQLTHIEARIRELKRALKAQSPGTAESASSSLFALAGARTLSAEQSERVLADLGFNWASTGDYLVVSKKTLASIGLDGMRGFKLDDTACKVLAVTPEERADIEAITQKLGADYQAWAEANVKRNEPKGDIVAQYTLSADPEFSQSLSNSYAGEILSALGSERGDQMLDYARTWMNDLGMYGGGTNSMTIKRYVAGNEPGLLLEVKRNGGMMTCGVSPHQPFPEAFLPLFPNGWLDLAQREGFELPKAFRKQ